MEILEIIWALIQGCGCLLDVFAATSAVGAGVAGVKANQERKSGKAAKARGEKSSQNKAAIWFVALLFIAFFLVGLMFFKYLGAANQPAIK